MGDIVGDLVVGALAESGAGGIQRRRSRRLAAASRIECSLRVHPGRASTKRGGWTHGVAELAPGQFRFTAYLPPGIRIRNPFRPRQVIEVVDKPWIGARLPTSFWGPGPGTVGITIVSPSATYQVAVRSPQADWFVEAISPSPMTERAGT